MSHATHRNGPAAALSSPPANDPMQQALAAGFEQFVRSPAFADAIVDALRGSPAFAGMFAEKLATAISIPEFVQMMATALRTTPEFDDGYTVAPFMPLFERDRSYVQPATYSAGRAATLWAHVTNTVLDFVSANCIGGDLYEFGTLHGYTARHFALALARRGELAEMVLRLFDTFTGFPEIESETDRVSYAYTDNGWTTGGCASQEGTSEHVRRMLGTILPGHRFMTNVGPFAETLIPSVAPRPAAVIHMDCDLYESSKVVLDRLDAFGVIQDGTVIIWDDFNCARGNPEFGERRSMHEAFDNNPRFSCEHWFAYGWHGQVSIVHERGVVKKRRAALVR